MKTGLLLMTAMPPTKGHAYLIDFAREFLQQYGSKSILHVIVNGRKHEPITTDSRVKAFKEHFGYDDQIAFHSVTKDVPQEPAEHPDFWAIWADLILKTTTISEFDFVFASEAYGVTLAEIVGAKFVPFNIDRTIIPMKATEVRADPIKNFSHVLPAYQKQMRLKVTIFGPESVGKTTITKALSERIDGHFIPEWCRGYLETAVTPEVTLEKMEMITRGQYAVQKSVDKLIDKPFIFRDTDLLSTVGYYQFWNNEVPDLCASLCRKSLADLYILMNDQIPFTPDILRYGGDHRESDNAYWRQLLETWGCQYYEVQSFYPKAQTDEVEKYCLNAFHRKNDLRFIR